MTPPDPQPSVPFNPTPTSQRVDIQEFETPDGTKIIALLVIQPCASFAVYLDHGAARQLADQLFSRANGLSVVRDMPGEGT